MLIKIVLGVVVLGLSSHACLAQAQKPSSALAPLRTVSLDIYPWLLPSTCGLSGLTLFPWIAPAQTWEPTDMDWGRAELASRFATIRRGTPLKIAVQRLRLLGGVEDGGLQTIPATRYFFKPGYIVTIPQKEGRVSGPLQVALGQMASD